MKKLTIIIFFVPTLLLTSCNYFSYINQQKKYKNEFKKEIIFVESLISNPKIIDSLILKSAYYEPNFYDLIKLEIRSMKSTILNSMKNDCPPEIINLYVGENYKLRKERNIQNYLGILVNVDCKNEKDHFFGIVFSKINGELKVVDIYEVNTN